jgi:hypothetical protein
VANNSLDSQRAGQEIARLTDPGVLGFYTHFEATEVFAIPAGQSVPINVFSILVAEERPQATAKEPDYLNPQRIKLKSVKDWTFGIKRYVKPITELVPAFDNLCASKSWQLSGEPLQVGDLVPIPRQFVPPDSTGVVPLNRVLKNNFWNGSYLFDWADPIKTTFQLMFDDPPTLQELSDAIRSYVPIGLAGLSDRLGNIVVQLPVNVLIAKFGQMRSSGDFRVTIAWHPNATPRPLRATCEKQYDLAISEFMSANVQTRETLLPMQGGQGMHRGVVWDDQNRVLLAASGDLSLVSAVSLRMHMVGPDRQTRVFTIRDAKGSEKEIRVALITPAIENVVGEPSTNPAGDWTQHRIYREEAARLAQERRFVQYKPDPGQQLVEHERALADVRLLINQHGREGAWLWDPYLSADDILNTLFYCQFPDSDLRALTAGYIPPPAEGNPSCMDRLRACFPGRLARRDTPSRGMTFAERQRTILEGTESNLLGLHLEYRAKIGSAGWAFHDRFLIFPVAARGALAWSLGTSINSIGKQHHILQQVHDGQLVMDAFLELWDKLDQPENFVWKTP